MFYLLEEKKNKVIENLIYAIKRSQKWHTFEFLVSGEEGLFVETLLAASENKNLTIFEAIDLYKNKAVSRKLSIEEILLFHIIKQKLEIAYKQIQDTGSYNKQDVFKNTNFSTSLQNLLEEYLQVIQDNICFQDNVTKPSNEYYKIVNEYKELIKNNKKIINPL